MGASTSNCRHAPSHPFDKRNRTCILPSRNAKATTLFQLVWWKDWQRVLIRATLFPKEVKKPCTVTLYGVYWNLVPLHLAVALKAPAPVIRALCTPQIAALPVKYKKSWSRIKRHSTKEFSKIWDQDQSMQSIPQERYRADSLISREQSIGDESLHDFLDQSQVVLQLSASGSVLPIKTRPLLMEWQQIVRSAQESDSLLPIHLACLYDAPVDALEIVIQAFSLGSTLPFMGLLPVHILALAPRLDPVVDPSSNLESSSLYDRVEAFELLCCDHPEVCTSKSILHGMTVEEYMKEVLEGDEKHDCLQWLQKALANHYTAQGVEYVVCTVRYFQTSNIKTQFEYFFLFIPQTSPRYRMR